MAGGIRQEELLGGSGIAADVKKDTADAIGVVDDGLVDRAGFNGVLKGHFEGVVDELVKFVWPYLLIADIDAGVEAGEIHIDPIRIFGDRIEKAAVLDDLRVNGIFEAERIVRLVE